MEKLFFEYMISSLSDLLENTASRYAQNIALEDLKGLQITYRQLNDKAEDYSTALRRIQVGAGDHIGLYAGKSVEMVAALFGILKSHAAYIPLDTSSPPERIWHMLRDAEAKAVLVDPALLETILQAFPDAKLLESKTHENALALISLKFRTTQKTEDLAYILYTSGSSGTPKGVMFAHASALRFVQWCTDLFAPTSDDRFSSHAPFHFDLSILDLYVSIRHGATLVLIDEDTGKRPSALASVIAEKGITSWYSTPSILSLMVTYGKMQRFDYPRLKRVLFAGEVFPVKHFRALYTYWPKPQYFNLYGPTETNVCTYYEIPRPIPEGLTTFPIGTTCTHYQSRILDEQGQGFSSSQEGELIAKGPFMQGYCNAPERTKRAFFQDTQGESWYRTGDIVRQNRDGHYVFIGRRDRMVKRRGYRIELGEIEAALYRHPDVAQAAVIASSNEEQGTVIKAYLSVVPSGSPSPIQMKQHCSQTLPAYMIPDDILFQADLPKTSTGKIDYLQIDTTR